MLTISRNIRVIFWLLAILLIGVPMASAQTDSVVFEAADCAFELAGSTPVDCGYLIVPEDRGDPQSPTIRLHVAIFRARTDNPQPDPIIYLEGGPGGSGIKQMEEAFELVFAVFSGQRDFIVIDQRGTGFSEPNLFCNEVIDLAFDRIDENVSAEQATSDELDALRECHQRLTDEGVNLSAYNSAENAADLEDLRRTLGYDEWNLFGISYGTRLALTAMRDYPEGIRSVVLDSSYPPQEDLYATLATNFDRVLGQTFAGCRADAACDEAYPDLETVFYETIVALDENPVTVSGVLPSSGKPLDVVVNGSVFASLMFQAYYQTTFIPAMPQIIYDASMGELSQLSFINLLVLDRADEISNGMNLSVQCSEEVPYSDVSAAAAEAEQFPVLKRVLDRQVWVGQGIFIACDLWDVISAPEIENEPVTSDIPTLVLAGEYDPITPPEWGRRVAETLENSYFFEFPGMGHGVSISDSCSTAMTLAFLDDPIAEPDASCMDGLTGDVFVVSSREITLVPFTNDLFGISGVIPEEWAEIGLGAHGRSSVGETAIAQQAMPGFDSAGVLGLLMPIFGIDETPEPVETITSEVLSWQYYELTAQGLAVHMALAEDEGGTIMVLLTALPGESAALYESVFLPALDALQRTE